MEIDWTIVKKKTLWQYEQLTAKLLAVLGYDFVREHYGHTMAGARAYAGRLQQGYGQGGQEVGFIDAVREEYAMLDALGVRDYADLVNRVAAKADCERFVRETGFPFESLVEVLDFLFRWVLPFKIPLKELLDTMPEPKPAEVEMLKKHKIRSNLDVLEKFRSVEGRREFSAKTGVREAQILALAHRADLSRLAYVRGRTIQHLCGGGYDTLEKLANAEPEKITADMTAYYRSIGKDFADFQAVIPLDWMTGGASVLPVIIEV